MATLVSIPPYKPVQDGVKWKAVRIWPDGREEFYNYSKAFGELHAGTPMRFSTKGLCARHCYFLNQLSNTTKVMLK